MPENPKIYYQGEVYDDLDSVPAVVTFNRTRPAIYRSIIDRRQEVPEIVSREVGDGVRVLTYKGATHIPTREGIFMSGLASRIAKDRFRGQGFTAFDVGTGSGVIAIKMEAALRGQEQVRIVGSDISGLALEVAELNIALNRVSDVVRLRRRDMLDGLVGEFGKPDLITSNPPFYTEGRYSGNGFEPDLVFNGGADGLQFYHRLFNQSAGVIHDESMIVVQVQDMSLRGVMSSLERHLPGVSAGTVVGPQERVCGLVIGSATNIQPYVDQRIA